MADFWFDVDVALAEVPVNIMPLIDDTDFKTRETAIAYNAAGMDLVWNFVTTAGAFTQTAVTPTTGGDYDWTHQGDGIYTIEIPASGGASINNDTEGFGWFTGLVTGVLPWRGPTLGFRAATINDALIDSTTLIDDKDNGLMYESTISSVTASNVYVMTDAFPHSTGWIGCVASVTDTDTGFSFVTHLTGATEGTETLTFNAAPPFTAAAGDKVRIYAVKDPVWGLGNYDAPTGTDLDNVFKVQLTESYAADGVAPTVEQALMMIQQMLTEFGISGTTLTVKELDGSTTAATFTLDSASTPTSLTRST